MSNFNKFMMTLIFVLGAAVTLAQSTCPALVQEALSATTAACSTLGRNQACYGNVLVESAFRTGSENLEFEAQGDIVDVAALDSLRLSPMVEDEGYWGVVLMAVQADLPETLPGQNVTLLLFGDVQVENAGRDAPTPPELSATATGAINVRSGPSTNAAVVGALAANETIRANGRNDAGDWLRFTQEDGSAGWVYAPLMTVEGSVNSLTAVADDSTANPFGPMQAFYFQSGIGDAPCQEAPNSGILIQTPPGAEQVELRINEVGVTLGSTAFVQAVPGGDLQIALLDGVADVTAGNITVIVPAGAQTTILLNADGRAAGPPSIPGPLDPDMVQALPVQAAPEPVSIPEPPSQAEVAESIVAIQTERYGATPFGSWTATDTDGSYMQMRIRDLGSGRADVYMYDAGASICSPDGGATLPPAGLGGQGRVDAAGNVSVSVTVRCLDSGTVLGPFQLTFSYDPDSGRLTDNFGVVWSR